jgi:dienelactone hydrolase
MRKNARLASAQLEQASIGEGVRRLAVREAGLRGTLFLPAAKESRPGVLVLGGSEGGLPARRAAWLASHGYVALALAYFHFEDLPQDLAAIPLEYFGHALGWMARRPEILPDRLAVMGGSRGGELSLQLGSMYPQIRAVVAYVPADARHGSFPAGARVPYAWTWQGMPLAFVSGRGGGNRLGATIAAERTEGPVMMISGGSDGVWESSSMADSVVERLKHAHFTYEVEHLKYPHAGHTAGRPEIVPAWQGTGNNRISGRTMHAGGSTEGNAASSIDAIPKVLDFLQRALRP